MECDGALEILSQELDRSLLDVLTLQEVRWPGEGNKESGNITLFHGVTEPDHLGTSQLSKMSNLLVIEFHMQF